jgi:hypothetical protein
MTEEEFQKLPSCLWYKDPEHECPKMPNQNDDWDELEDCCGGCTGFPYFARKYWSGFMNQSVEEVTANLK